MKRNFCFVVVFMCLMGTFQIVVGQSQNISDYLGKWRWVSGNNDTFQIVLLPNTKKLTTQNALPNTGLIGYHSYTEKGHLVESNLKEIGGRDTTIFSIIGSFQQNKVEISWFRDFTRDTKFRGSLQIVPGSPLKAIWNVPMEYEKFVYQGIGRREYPPGRTVPNNIVLEKVN
jgi:hypothetical protein